MSKTQTVARRTIPLAGIVLVLGTVGCSGWTLYSPKETSKTLLVRETVIPHAAAMLILRGQSDFAARGIGLCLERRKTDPPGRTGFLPEPVSHAGGLRDDSFGVGHSGYNSSQRDLVSLVQEFLTKVPSGDPAVFKKFFADEVIYTRASGLEIGKSDVLARTGGSQAGDPNVTFTGEDFIVHTYGNFAVVNFRLVMHSNKDEKITTQSFRNTGTFMKRNGEWQAIAWQATPIADK